MSLFRNVLRFLASLVQPRRRRTSSSPTSIRVHDIVGEYCITQPDGARVFDAIHPLLKAQNAVELDFKDVNIFASPFFNAAIGKLYDDISPPDLAALLTVVNISDDGNYVLHRVIENSREYYSHRIRRRRALDDSAVRHASGF